MSARAEWRNAAGDLHREDGPAVTRPDGTEVWYLDGVRHREGGPAVIYPDEYEAWYRNGRLHREDGPAIASTDGAQEWWLDGEPTDDRPCEQLTKGPTDD